MKTELMLQRSGLTIPCKISQPDSGPIRRVVLGVHGFGGSMEDTIQADIAEEMEIFYSATVRFDFPAHGKNPLQELELEPCIETLYTVAAYAYQYIFDGSLREARFY